MLAGSDHQNARIRPRARAPAGKIKVCKLHKILSYENRAFHLANESHGLFWREKVQKRPKRKPFDTIGLTPKIVISQAQKLLPIPNFFGMKIRS
jgi:hypothetical protein